MHFRWEGGTGRRRRKDVVVKEGVIVVTPDIITPPVQLITSWVNFMTSDDHLSRTKSLRLVFWSRLLGLGWFQLILSNELPRHRASPNICIAWILLPKTNPQMSWKCLKIQQILSKERLLRRTTCKSSFVRWSCATGGYLHQSSWKNKLLKSWLFALKAKVDHISVRKWKGGWVDSGVSLSADNERWERATC